MPDHECHCTPTYQPTYVRLELYLDVHDFDHPTFREKSARFSPRRRRKKKYLQQDLFKHRKFPAHDPDGTTSVSKQKTTKLARLYLAADERADQDNGRCMIQGQDGYKWGISEKEQNTSTNWLKYGNPAFFEDIHGLKNWAAVFLRQRSLGHGVHCPVCFTLPCRRREAVSRAVRLLACPGPQVTT